MVYSKPKFLERAVDTMVKRAKVQAKYGHPDYKLAYAGEVRDAQLDKPTYTVLEKRIRDEVLRVQKQYQMRIEKLDK